MLMPNTGRGGGISRKISNPADRKRLKKIASELDVPDGIGVIIRTAGLNRTKVEIKRDYEFLLRLWDDIRELTLKSMAPSCVYEEANLIKRSIRDLYSKEINEILVEGDDGYRIAKDFMRKLMPSHAKKVQPYRDRIPLFHRFQVEQQFASMYNPEVQLKSGGYIVINPTEALVSVDVNSGKATKERSIEETALKTNLEAAEEMARQLRLRDLAGLIVIDFIDMDDNRNNKAVERKLKECLKSDRARIQVGRISPFGLLEMSRQRLRPSFLETSTNSCPTCGGSGFVRSTESTALLIIRALEEEGVRERSSKITVTVHTDVAIYLLNQKRAVIQELESLYGITILIMADPTMNLNDHKIDREKGSGGGQVVQTANSTQESNAVQVENEATPDDGEEKESNSAKRRRRRRRRKNRDERNDNVDTEEASADTVENTGSTDEEASDDEEPRRRRRGKRGGRRRSRNSSTEQQGENETASNASEEIEPEIVVIPIGGEEPEHPEVKATDEKESSERKPARRRGRPRKAKPEEENSGSTETVAAGDEAEVSSVEEEAKPEKVRPRRRRSPRRKSEETSKQAAEARQETETVDIEPEMVPLVAIEDEETEKPKAKPKRTRTRRKKPENEEQATEVSVSEEGKEPKVTETVAEQKPEPVQAQEQVEISTEAASEPKAEEPKKPKRRGWWSRR